MTTNQPQNLYQRIRKVLAHASDLAVARGLLTTPVAAGDVPLDRPRQASHGDLATNLCFTLAKAAGKNPRALAEAFVPLVREADSEGWIAGAEVAGPGFLNLRLTDKGWQGAVADVLAAGEAFGRCDAGHGSTVLLEFVSANPTGPMHVGHGRGAVLGDALARILRAANFRVTTEYYINNVGNQVAKLGESVWYWVRELDRVGSAIAVARVEEDPLRLPEGFPEDGYRGRYIAEMARNFLGQTGLFLGADAPAWDDDGWWAAHDGSSQGGRPDDRALTRAAWQAMMERIREDLQVLDISFDSWFSERRLHGLDPDTRNQVKDLTQRLIQAGWAYSGSTAGDDESGVDQASAEGPGPADDSWGGQAIFFKGTREDVPKAYRDGKDRVIIRGDGRPTYFAADIAYHDDKVARGFDNLINILGADHHGYVSRLKGVLHALGDLHRAEGDPQGGRWSGDKLEVLLIQMVALLREGKPVPMGKRSGEFVTLREVVEEVTTSEPTSGRDAVRFIFLTRKADAQLDFDLEVAKRTSMDNPVYYVQYGHARLASILQRAETLGRGLKPGADLAGLRLDDERELALLLAELPEVVGRAARGREPHLVAYYLMDACRAFHAYYSKNKADNRVITDDVATTQARLALVEALRQAIANGLQLLGVTAPARMATLEDEA